MKLMPVLLSMLILSCLVDRMEAQSWEEIYNQQFSYPPVYPIPGWFKTGFSRVPFGLSGSPSDNCESSAFTTSTTVLAYQAGLDPAYEYYFSYSAKASAAGKIAQFYHHTSIAFAGTAIGTAFELPLAWQTIQSPVISGLSGNIYLKIAPGAGNSTAGGASVKLDNFRLYRRPVQLQEVVFPQAALLIEEGANAQVCVTISAAPSSVQTVTVGFEGETQPHFSGFQPQNLVFPQGQTGQQCFTLNALASGQFQDNRYEYTLYFQQLSQGLEAGAPATLVVTVQETDPAPECLWAGPDQTICQGAEVQLGCTPDPNTAYCYKWEPETGFVEPGGWFLLNPVVNPEQTTTYTLTIIDEEWQIIATDEATVSVLEKPNPAIHPNPALFCENSALTLSEPSQSADYSWSTGQTGNAITISQPGTYSVTATGVNGCSGEATIEVGSGASLADIQAYFEKKGFYAFPITVPPDQPGVIKNDQVAGKKTTINSLCELDHCENITGVCVQDDATLLFEWNGYEVNNLAALIEENLGYFLSEYGYEQPVGIITKNENLCLCADYLALAEERIQASAPGFWFHVFDNPSDDQDLLFFGAKTPSSPEYYPAPGSGRRSFIAPFVQDILLTGQSAGFGSPVEKALFSAQQLSLDNFAGELSEVDFVAEPPQGGGAAEPDCPPLLENPKAVAPSGIPLELTGKNILRFRTSFPNLMDERSMSGFTHFPGNGAKTLYYEGLFKEMSQVFIGYHAVGLKRELTNDPVYQSPVIPQGLPVKVTLAERLDVNQATQTEDYFQVYQRNYKCLKSIHPKGEGGLEPDFDAPHVAEITIAQDPWGALLPVRLPALTHEHWLEAEEFAKFNPFGFGGVLMKAFDPEGNLFYIFGLIDSDNPQGLSYYYWNCAVGLWLDYTPPEAEMQQMDFLTAIWEVISDDEFLHGVLDGTSAVPVVGSPIDLIHGFWYLFEGEFGEAGLAFVGILPFIGDGIQILSASGKYAIRYGDEVINGVRALGFRKCVTGAQGGNPLLSTHLAVSAFPICEIRTYGAAVKKLLDPAANGGQHILTPASTEGLINWMVNTQNLLIAKVFNDYPLLARIWDEPAFQGLTDEKRIKLLTWLNNAKNPSLIQEFISDPEIVQGWKFLDEIYSETEIQRVKDILLIKKIKGILTQSPAIFMEKLGADGSDPLVKLKKIIKNNSLAHCKACGPPNAGNRHLKDIDEYLDDIQNFVENFSHLPGGNQLIQQMQNGTIFQVDEAAQTLRLLKETPSEITFPITKFQPKLANENPDPSLIDEIEDELAESIDYTDNEIINNIGDIAHGPFNDQKLTELKSYGKSSIDKIPTKTQFKDQLTAYFRNNNVVDADALNYIFDARKLSKNSGNPFAFFENTDIAREYILSKFQQIYINNPGIYDLLNQEFKISHEINDLDHFNTLVGQISNPDNPLYKFIKVI